MLIVYKTFLRICHISVSKVLMSLGIFSGCFSVRTAIGCFPSICQFYFLPFYFLSFYFFVIMMSSEIAWLPFPPLAPGPCVIYSECNHSIM